MRRRRRENRYHLLGPAGRRPAALRPQLVGADTAAAASAQLPVTYVLALLAASAAVVITFAACGRRSKYHAPTEVEIPPLDPDGVAKTRRSCLAFRGLIQGVCL